MKIILQPPVDEESRLLLDNLSHNWRNSISIIHGAAAFIALCKTITALAEMSSDYAPLDAFVSHALTGSGGWKYR